MEVNVLVFIALGVSIGVVLSAIVYSRKKAANNKFTSPLVNLAKDAFKVATAEYIKRADEIGELPTCSIEERDLRKKLASEYLETVGNLATDLATKLHYIDTSLTPEELLKTAKGYKYEAPPKKSSNVICL